MRDKEVKQDYRFMPEPNLPPLRLSYGKVNNSNILNINDITLVELPEETRKNTIGKKHALKKYDQSHLPDGQSCEKRFSREKNRIF